MSLSVNIVNLLKSFFKNLFVFSAGYKLARAEAEEAKLKDKIDALEIELSVTSVSIAELRNQQKLLRDNKADHSI